MKKGYKVLIQKLFLLLLLCCSSLPILAQLSPLNIGTIPKGKRLVIQYEVTVNSPLPAGLEQISSQGTVSGANFTSKLTDDPATEIANDPTLTELDGPPTVLSINRHEPAEELTNATEVVFRILFSEQVSGVDVSDFALTTTGATTASIASLAAFGTEGTTYDVTVTTISGDGTVRLDLNSSGTGIEDAAGNTSGGFTGGQTYTIDQTAPTLSPVTIVSTNANPALVKVGDVITLSFTASEVLGGTPLATIAGQAATVTPGSGISYTATYTMTSSDAEGVIGFSINVRDVAGNAGAEVTSTTNSSSVTFDKTAPTVVSINRQDPSSAMTTTTSVQWRVIFSETVSGVDVADFQLTSTGTISGATISSVSASSGAAIDVTVSSISATGGSTLRLDLKASGTGIVDAASNAISSGFTTGEVYTFGSPPQITTCPTSSRVDAEAGKCYASVSFAAVASGSPDPTVVYTIGTTEISSPYLFPVGVTTVTATASNGISPSATCQFTVTVVDNEAPVISGISASPAVLAPPNHKMRDVTINYSVADNCTAVVVTELSVTSNEPTNGTGDGDTDVDWEIIDEHRIRLRAERAGSGDGRIYTITITATDEAGKQSQETVHVVVAHNITSPVSGSSYKVGSTVALKGSFWDIPGNRHTAQWQLDGTTTKATLTEPSGMKNGSVAGSYKFTSPGVYKVRMNVTDQHKVTTYATTNGDLEAIVVIYDPSGGYTVGGGWFYSPQGALSANPRATGKVSYGFTSAYYKKATIPKGETQFEFKAGEFEFNALNFEYLAVSGARAQFKGSGNVVGDRSGYAFIMTVIDGDAPGGGGVDKIRMKIFNKNTGEVIYDNERGASDAADPFTAVGGNSVIDIIGSSTRTVTANRQADTSLEGEQPLFEVMAFPNPSLRSFRVSVRSDSYQQPIALYVYDLTGRLVETKTITDDSAVEIGEKYPLGTYLLWLVQGKRYEQVKLIKLK
ncbi:HYR domain-containing protein [Cesiribacter andamanensis]|uniref:HYR domain-containing protein n=1 Tax=Cesiribacter andamanensis AMV16 TaxID=1279009 RepID=M7NWG7_9BACT|nr:HYR domain-containing protein [Cesiribacter andamanensis]EMR02769.1 hypothetical protein ADICEAN_02097 [Cesiribacter andamanensis AMV16]